MMQHFYALSPFRDLFFRKPPSTPLLEEYFKTCLHFDYFQRSVWKILSRSFHIFIQTRKAVFKAVMGVEPWRKREIPGILETQQEVNQSAARFPRVGGRSARTDAAVIVMDLKKGTLESSSWGFLANSTAHWQLLIDPHVAHVESSGAGGVKHQS